jgi:hypothetical protein
MGSLEFWQLGGRSDAEVVGRLEGLVGSTRQLTAELVAHLGEVEERRLHLSAAFGSMFQYCTTRLGLSEDEACRRIEVARLARRFPVLFPALAGGELSLSVTALMKPYLFCQKGTKATWFGSCRASLCDGQRNVWRPFIPGLTSPPACASFPTRPPRRLAWREPSRSSARGERVLVTFVRHQPRRLAARRALLSPALRSRRALGMPALW